MATVTKLKGKVNNKSLPILLEDGTLSNYYFGRFMDKISEMGYNPTNAERQALDAFVQKGMSSWLNYVRYCVPFIGDYTSPNAGAVPLIDNVGDFAMAEYEDGYNASDMFEYDDEGKITSQHGKNLTKRLKTPVDFNLDRGFFALFYLDLVDATNLGSSYLILSQDDTNYTPTRYNRIRYAASNGLNQLGYQFEGDRFTFPKDGRTAVEVALTTGESGIFCLGNYVSENEEYKQRQYYDVGGFVTEKLVIPSAMPTMPSANYGKYDYGRNMEGAYNKFFMMLDPLIPSNMLTALKDDVKNLMIALGRA